MHIRHICMYYTYKTHPHFHENDDRLAPQKPGLQPSIYYEKQRSGDLSTSELYDLLNPHPSRGTVAIFKLS